MKWVLGIGLGLMLLKFITYGLTRSNAVLTDALESIINVLAGGFTLWSLHYASQPRDRNHPYGHGKIEYFASGLEGGMIGIAGFFMVYKSVYSIFYPPQLKALDYGIALTLLTGLINYFMARRLIRIGTALSSSGMVADGTHLLTDTWSSLALVAGLFLIHLTGWVLLDTLLTAGLGVLIIWTGFKLIREAWFNLMDKTDPMQMERLLEAINRARIPEWIDLHHCRIQKHGAVLHLDAHVTLPWYIDLKEVHRHTADLQQRISQHYTQEIECNIHADPCIPQSCKICSVSNCSYRLHAMEQQVNWTVDNIWPDTKHRIYER